MRVPHNSFIVVTDSKRTLYFRNQGDADFPNLVLELKQEHENPADRDQKSYEAGRVFSSTGDRRSAYEEADYHKLGEDRFAAETGKMLKLRALRNDFQSLIVVAPPKTLGELRKHYHKEVEKRLTGEIFKDLTAHPIAEIEKILRDQ